MTAAVRGGGLGRGGVVVQFEGWSRGLVGGQCRCERGTGLCDAGKGSLAGGVIDLPGGRPLGEAMNTAGVEGGSLLHGSQCAEGV